MSDEYLWDDDGTDVSEEDPVMESAEEYGTDGDGPGDDPPVVDSPPDLENQNAEEEL